MNERTDLIGPTEITEVLRAGIGADITFAGLLDRVTADLKARRRQPAIPFERVLEAVQPERNLSYHPLFQTTFEHSATGGAPIEFDSSLSAEVTSLPGGTAQDVSLLVDDASCTLEFNRDLFTVPSIERMLGHYRQLLASIVENPEAPIIRLPMLTPKESRQLLVDWNATAVDHRTGEFLHVRFEQQAAETPNETAAIFGEESLTYDELKSPGQSTGASFACGGSFFRDARGDQHASLL
ncbi:MAG: condensation domain-containing protein [Chthoniobacter sp.]